MIERPLDFLNERKGCKVLIKIKDQEKTISGTLISFDIHINIVLTNEDGDIEFIRGDNILSIS